MKKYTYEKIFEKLLPDLLKNIKMFNELLFITFDKFEVRNTKLNVYFFNKKKYPKDSNQDTKGD